MIKGLIEKFCELKLKEKVNVKSQHIDFAIFLKTAHHTYLATSLMN